MAHPHSLHVARIFACFAFVALLCGLAWGLLRARRQVLHDEADAVLEREFQRLERKQVTRD